MNTESQSLPILLQSAESYLYFQRNWLDFLRNGHYNEMDTVVWWQERGRHRCCCFIAEEQENGDIITQQLIDRDVAEKDFQRLLDKTNTLGIAKIAPQNERFTTAHFDDVYGVKLQMGLSHVFTVNGARHRDKRVSLITQLIRKNAPELWEYYDEKG